MSVSLNFKISVITEPINFLFEGDTAPPPPPIPKKLNKYRILRGGGGLNTPLGDVPMNVA